MNHIIIWPSIINDILTLSPQGGISALILATRYGHTDTIVELVKAGAKLDLQDKVGFLLLRIIFFIAVIILTVSTQNGDSAVIRATMEQEPATLMELVRAGSDLNLQNRVRCIHS